jgi:hypothetical protein
MDPEHPVPLFGDGMLLWDLPATAIETIVTTAGVGSGSPLLSVELRHLGGALERRKFQRGAVSSLDADFVMFAAGLILDTQSRHAVRDHVDAVQRALGRWDTGGMYLNFAQRPRHGEALFGEETYRRLREVKTKYDPQNVIRANHPIPPIGFN